MARRVPLQENRYGAAASPIYSGSAGSPKRTALFPFSPLRFKTNFVRQYARQSDVNTLSISLLVALLRSTVEQSCRSKSMGASMI